MLKKRCVVVDVFFKMHACVEMHFSPLHACGSDLPRRQDVVHVLQEGLVFDFIVGEDETGSFALLAGCSVQALQVLHQVGCVV